MKSDREDLDDTDIFLEMLGKHGLPGVHLQGDVYDLGNQRGYAMANLRLAGNEFSLQFPGGTTENSR